MRKLIFGEKRNLFDSNVVLIQCKTINFGLKILLSLLSKKQFLYRFGISHSLKGLIFFRLRFESVIDVGCEAPEPPTRCLKATYQVKPYLVLTQFIKWKFSIF